MVRVLLAAFPSSSYGKRKNFDGNFAQFHSLEIDDDSKQVDVVLEYDRDDGDDDDDENVELLTVGGGGGDDGSIPRPSSRLVMGRREPPRRCCS